MPSWLAKAMTPLMTRWHRRSGNRFREMDLAYVTTVGARSGQSRTTPVARFDDGAGGWYVVASAGGAARHPDWYLNIVAHPDQVLAEVNGTTRRVHVEQLDGERRARAWEQVVARSPRFAAYTDKTDRHIPVLHLTPTPT